MQKMSLQALAREQQELAAAASSGRSARTVWGGHEHVLRQTLIALTAGSAMSEHENPGEATLQVMVGRVRLDADGNQWEGRQGDLLFMPPGRHSLLAVEDAVVLLTVAKTELGLARGLNLLRCSRFPAVSKDRVRRRRSSASSRGLLGRQPTQQSMLVRDMVRQRRGDHGVPRRGEGHIRRAGVRLVLASAPPVPVLPAG